MNVVARLKECGRIAIDVEQTQRCASNDVPTAGRFSWIDSRLRSTDRHGTRRNFLPRRRAPRRGELRWQSAEIRKARGETDTAHAIARSAMPANNLVAREPGVSRDLVEIGSELALVTHRNFDDGLPSGARARRLQIVVQRTL